MTESAHAVRHKALTLPHHDRAELAADLIASLDDAEPAPEVDAAWAIELERRAREALADSGSGEDWAVVRDRLRTRLASE